MTFHTAFDRAQKGKMLEENDLILLLSAQSDERQALFTTARRQRERYFGDKIALYGFVYFSTYCRNACSFCLYRQANGEHRRYRKSLGEIIAVAKALAASGVHCIDLTMGEDPAFLGRGSAGWAELAEIVRTVKKETDLPIMISPGVVPEQALDMLQAAGADWYACYQETHNRALFEQLRIGQDYDRRWRAKRQARSIGMLIEEGLLVGAGETLADCAESLLGMARLKAAQTRAMTFIPQPDTPLAEYSPENSDRELNLIAVMRLLFPWALIPASLDVEGVAGLKARLAAGANVVTSLIPPASGLQGVSRVTQDIDEGLRDVAGILPILGECGLRPMTLAEYREWMELLRGGRDERRDESRNRQPALAVAA